MWLDVGVEPWIISVPDMKQRYYLLPMLAGWTTVFDVPGTRTTGGVAQKFAVTGPGWSGTLPVGVKQYRSPTAMVWLLGRIYCTGTPADYKAVHASGSGIPHVESALTSEVLPAPYRLVPVKFVGGVLAIGSGLALGREGSSPPI